MEEVRWRWNRRRVATEASMIAISRKLRRALREIRSGWTEQQQIAAARGVKRSSSSIVPPRKGRERKGGE